MDFMVGLGGTTKETRWGPRARCRSTTQMLGISLQSMECSAKTSNKANNYTLAKSCWNRPTSMELMDLESTCNHDCLERF